MKKRFLALICALLAVCMLFVSCSKNSGEDTSDSSENASSLTLAADKKASCRIVYPSNATVFEKEIAENIKTKIFSMTGATPTVGDDYILGGAEHDSESVEILVGLTSYKETAEALSGIGYGDYIVKIVGNKLVVAAYTEKALNRAFEALYGYFAPVDGVLTVDGSFVAQKTVFEDLSAVPKIKTEGNILFADAGDNSYTLTVKNATRGELEAYGATLAAGGFEKLEERTTLANDMPYINYKGAKASVSALFIPSSSIIKVMIDSLSSSPLPPIEKQSFNDTYSELFIQVGTADDVAVTNGMCYILRLGDGSFIVSDGGYDDSDKGENGAQLYSLLKQYAPDPNNIVVAAWFISHAHIDHIGALVYFAEQMADGKYGNVKIEKLFCNLPSASQALTDPEENMVQKIAKYRATLQTLKKSGTEIHKAHIGQRFFIRNAEIDVMYSYDAICHETAIQSSNDTSVVFHVKFGDSTIMLTGDIGPTVMALMANIYDTALKCDILQVPHHGYNGQGLFYQKVDPKYAFVPASKAVYNKVITQSQLAELVKAADHLVPAYYDTVVYDLSDGIKEVSRKANAIV